MDNKSADRDSFTVLSAPTLINSRSDAASKGHNSTFPSPGGAVARLVSAQFVTCPLPEVVPGQPADLVRPGELDLLFRGLGHRLREYRGEVLEYGVESLAGDDDLVVVTQVAMLVEKRTPGITLMLSRSARVVRTSGSLSLSGVVSEMRMSLFFPLRS